MSQKHTPLPWYPAEYETTENFRAVKRHRAVMDNCRNLVAVTGPLGDEKTEIDTAMIVRAVNSHYELVEALEAASKSIEDTIRFESADGRGYQDLSVEQEILDRARAALQKAKGNNEK